MTQTSSESSLSKSAPAAEGAVAQKVLIIGLDGATFDVLNPMMEEGRMPRLRAFLAGGASGILHSTQPPITPAAWTTFMTGRSPGHHGILDFERYDVRTHQLSFNTTRCLDHVGHLWQILGHRGYKVGAVHIPMTFPPVPVNGFMISGFETPSVEAEFTYPAHLKAKILERWPDYNYKTRWKRKTFGGMRLFQENLDYISRSFHQGAEITRFCGDEYGWDVLMVVFKLVDNLQHKTWKYVDPTMKHRYPRAKVEACAKVHEELDRAIGSLLDYARDHQAHVLMMSDHGHGLLEGKVQPNLLLKQWGHLVLKEGGAQPWTRGQYLLRKNLRKQKERFARSFSIESDLAVDFSKTRACVMHAGMTAYLYLNLHGRQETGIVSPSDYEPLREDLAVRFRAAEARDRQGSTFKLFPEVHKPEELYGCEREGREWMPDLMLVPRAGLAAVRKIRGRSAVQWLSERKLEGTHRVEGIFAASGPGIVAGRTLRANLIDTPMTLLAMLGQPIPDDMEGRVIEEIFERTVNIERCKADERTATPQSTETFSDADTERLNRRLRDLGYLE